MNICCDEESVGSSINRASLLLDAAGVENARTEAGMLLCFACGCRREDLIRDPDRVLSNRESLIFNKSVELRSQRRPLAYITGERWFYGRQFKVNRAVLIPRPETEMLVEFALEKCANLKAPITIADIGTGSGCIAVSIAVSLPHAYVTAVDISRLALLVAAKNVRRHLVADRVTLIEGDLLSPLDNGRYDLIVSNPPYIAAADIAALMPEVGVYEPPLALYAGAGGDGTALHRELFTISRSKLKAGGRIAVEVGDGQANTVAECARDYGYKDVEIRADFAAINRVVAAQWNG